MKNDKQTLTVTIINGHGTTDKPVKLMMECDGTTITKNFARMPQAELYAKKYIYKEWGVLTPEFEAQMELGSFDPSIIGISFQVDKK